MSQLRRGLVGATVSLVWVGCLYVGAPLVGGFGVSAIAQAIIALTPGWLSTAFIGLFGELAVPLLIASIISGIAVAGAFFGILWSSRPATASTRRRGAVGVGVLLTTVVLFASGATVSFGFLAVLALALVAPALAGWTLTDPSMGVTDRRPFLRRTAAVAVGGALGFALLRQAAERLGESTEIARAGEPLDRSISTPTGDSDFDFGSMPPAVVPPEDHYTIDINVEHPRVDPEPWSLDIGGAVEQPYALSYDELLDHDGSVETTMTMLCISNPVGGDLIGTAHWTGVQLSDLVAAADPSEGAVDIVTRATDGYSEAIPIELAEREDILIAYGMGENSLETEHGFPARLLIPGRYGMKMTKWITDIELSRESHEAYWEERGWDDVAIVNTMSYIRTIQREEGTTTVGGVAFAGLETGVEEIAAVEVSADGGNSWTEATLEDQFDPHARRRWRIEFDTPDLPFEVVVRTRTNDGELQTEAESDGAPSGSTGWHRVEVAE